MHGIPRSCFPERCGPWRAWSLTGYCHPWQLVRFQQTAVHPRCFGRQLPKRRSCQAGRIHAACQARRTASGWDSVQGASILYLNILNRQPEFKHPQKSSNVSSKDALKAELQSRKKTDRCTPCLLKALQEHYSCLCAWVLAVRRPQNGVQQSPRCLCLQG